MKRENEHKNIQLENISQYLIKKEEVKTSNENEKVKEPDNSSTNFPSTYLCIYSSSRDADEKFQEDRDHPNFSKEHEFIASFQSHLASVFATGITPSMITNYLPQNFPGQSLSPSMMSHHLPVPWASLDEVSNVDVKEFFKHEAFLERSEDLHNSFKEIGSKRYKMNSDFGDSTGE